MNKLAILFLGPREYLTFLSRKITTHEWIYFETIQDINQNRDRIVGILDASMKVKFSEAILEKLYNLKVFVTATTGSTHIDEEYLKCRNIPLLTLKGQREFLKNITPAAEHSWLLLLMCARKIRPVFEDIEKCIWDRDKHPGIMLNGKTLGIIGCGRIGQWMARYGDAFGMNCLGYDPYLNNFPPHLKKSNLEELLRKSDFITLHVNYEKSLEKFIDEKEFNLMKKGVVFINTSRGALINENILLKKIEEGQIGAVGLDVLSDEPFIEKSKILQQYKNYKNIIITPHIGGFSPDALKVVLDFCCKRINKLI